MNLGLSNTYAEQLDGLYVPWTPEGFPNPKVIQLNEPLVQALGLHAATIHNHGAQLFSGNEVPTDASPLAQAYAGHQFGGFSPQLGDGRAVLLGEIVDPQGKRWDLQLKGSGPTPFSRGGDGKATLGPILREYLVGEAMHWLGIPTTRVLAALTTGEGVRRDTMLPGAVLARVASSHLRVGTLQFFAARREVDKLERLVHYTLARHYPDQLGSDNPALALLRSVAEAQAKLIAQWMQVGFIHGVMNTDNTTLSGETIDYGPCAFIEAYDPATTFSSIDHQGRYAFGNQAGIGQWNLSRMAEALLPLFSDDSDQAVDLAMQVLTTFGERYDEAFVAGMRTKLGLADADPADQELVQDLHKWMHQTQQDFTLTFRRLSASLGSETPAFSDPTFASWNKRWRARLSNNPGQDIMTRMDAVNPLYIPRNHLVEDVLEAALVGDMKPFHTMLKVLQTPFTEQPGHEAFAEPAPADFGPHQTFCGT